MNRFMILMMMAGMIITQIPSAIAGIPLGPAQLKSLAPGRYKVTLMGVSNMTVTFRSNGTIFGAAAGKIDNGHWNLSGNEICIAWNTWLNGSVHCSDLISEAGYYQGRGFTIMPI